MPLNAIQQHVVGLLDGLAMPIAGMAPLEAWVQPPVWEGASRPLAYVWGQRGRARRQTMPRGAGYTEITWPLDIWLGYQDAPVISPTGPVPPGPTDPQLVFPVLVDTILYALWGAEMAIWIADPTTGRRSQLQSIADEWDLDVPPARAVAAGRQLWFAGLLTVTCLEVVQA